MAMTSSYAEMHRSQSNTKESGTKRRFSFLVHNFNDVFDARTSLYGEHYKTTTSASICLSLLKCLLEPLSK